MSEPTMDSSEGQCPVVYNRPTSNREWWPEAIDLSALQANPRELNPMVTTSTTPRRSRTLDYDALKQDLTELMTDSQEWWPADYGHYGLFFFIRMSARRRYVPDQRRPRRWRRSAKQRFAPA